MPTTTIVSLSLSLCVLPLPHRGDKGKNVYNFKNPNKELTSATLMTTDTGIGVTGKVTDEFGHSYRLVSIALADGDFRPRPTAVLPHTIQKKKKKENQMPPTLPIAFFGLTNASKVVPNHVAMLDPLWQPKLTDSDRLLAGSERQAAVLDLPGERHRPC